MTDIGSTATTTTQPPSDGSPVDGGDRHGAAASRPRPPPLRPPPPASPINDVGVVSNAVGGGGSSTPEAIPRVRTVSEELLSPLRVPQYTVDGHLTDSDVLFISKNMDLTRKDSQMMSTLKPRNKAINRKAPPHVIVRGLDDLMEAKKYFEAWFIVVWRIKCWNLDFTKEEQIKETKKSQQLAKDNAALYRKYRKWIDLLMQNRPQTIYDIFPPSTAEEIVELPRRSARGEEQRLAEDVAREAARTSDPALQARIRASVGYSTEQANTNTSRRRTASAASAAPAAVHVGLGSSESDRTDYVETQGRQRAASRRRTLGQNSATAGGRADQVATRSVDNAHRAAAIAVETMYYRPTHQTTAVATSVPFHGALTISMNEFAPYNAGGGRSGSGRRADKPTVTITAASRKEAYQLCTNCIEALKATKGQEADETGYFEDDTMRIRLNLKDESTSLLDTVKQHQETLKQSRSRPQHTRASSAVVQNSMPAGLVSAQMSPGIHDHPRSRSGAVLGV